MPRAEKPIDPLDGPIAAFAHDLRMLREKAGRPPYRTLAKRAGYSASTLSVAASAAALPSLDVTLAYVQACGGDPEPWRERWYQLAADELRRSSVGTEPNKDPDAPVQRSSVPRLAKTALILVFGIVTSAICLRVERFRRPVGI